MADPLVVGIASLVVLGIAAHWLAWRVRLAPILFFLVIGFIAGPVTGFLEPDEMLGDLLAPVVSIGVAVILFEGGLSLRFREVREHGGIVTHLVTTSVLLTWLLGAIAAHLLLDLSTALSLLLGSILVVSGPTVVGPLLRHVRPRGAVGPILKWEGIMIDPVGALLALIVFDAIVLGDAEAALLATVLSVSRAVFVGGLLGLIGAALLVLVLLRYWVPDFLQSAVALMLILMVLVASNMIQPESGLLAVTIMGMALANQRLVDLGRIVEFKETLRVLIIPALFILLTARLELSDLRIVGPASLLFLAYLVLFVRPLSVLVATHGRGLDWTERAFIAGLMPRGIVAAAVAAVFALRLESRGMEGADVLVPYTFLIILGTGILHSLTARPLGRLLGVAEPEGGVVLLVGANPFARSIAKVLGRLDLEVLLIDTNRANVTAANVEDLDALRCNALSDRIDEEIQLERVDQVFAITPNDETNMLAALHLGDYVGRAEAYQLPMQERREPIGRPARHLAGRMLFGANWTYGKLSELMRHGWTVKSTKITEEFTIEDYRARYEEHHVPLFLVEGRRVLPFTRDRKPPVLPGTALIALVDEAAVQRKAQGLPPAA